MYATLIGFAAQQLQGTERIYAGNFNVLGDTQQQTLGTYQAKLGYAGTYTNGKPAKSVVQYAKDGGGFLTGDDVFVSAADYGFACAPSGAPTLAIRNVLDLDIVASNGSIRDALSDASETVEVTIMPQLAAIAGKPAANVVEYFLNGQPLPPGSDNRTAAAIIHRNFISEHLPVAISFA
jgi:hypothetical protein